MYSLVPVTPSTTTLDDVAGGWLGSHRRSVTVGGWEDGVEATPNDGSICPQTLGAKTISGESFEGHSLGFHVGSYRNESFPEALLNLNQPAPRPGVAAPLGDAAADAEAKASGVAEADDPEVVAALVLQPATAAPRRISTPVRTRGRTPAVPFIAKFSRTRVQTPELPVDLARSRRLLERRHRTSRYGRRTPRHARRGVSSPAHASIRQCPLSLAIEESGASSPAAAQQPHRDLEPPDGPALLRQGQAVRAGTRRAETD